MTARWSVPMDTLIKRSGADVDKVVRKATFELFSSVVRKSPVDTGRFRANWNVSYGAPDANTTESTQAARALAAAQKALTLPTGGKVYLTNGLPYAQRLEYGWSQQAPAGMIRLSVAEMKLHLSKASA